jgi:hypothetical protein
MTEVLTRRAAGARVNSFDPETRTFTAIASSGAPVVRRDWEGEWIELLSMKAGSIRLDRLKSGRAPILDSHRRFAIGDQLGVVTGAAIQDGQLVVTGRLFPTEQAQSIADCLAAGNSLNVSLGYMTHKAESSTDASGKRTSTATDWEPMELSITPIAADPSAHIRTEKGTIMERNETIEPAPAISPPAAPAQPTAWSAPDIVRIKARAAAFGIGADAVLDVMADANVRTLDQATDALQARAAQGNAPRQRPHHMAGVATNDQTLANPEFLARTIEDALYARMSGRPAEGAAAEIRGRSLLDLGAMLIEAHGGRPNWRNRDLLAAQILTRSGMHTTGDFPVLLTQSGNRVLMESFKAAQTPLKNVAAPRDASDFRALTSVKLGEAPKLLEVPESGEIKHGTRAEAKESFRLKTFARIFSLSRQAIINDDLGAFADTNRAWGRAAAEAEASELVALLTANSGNGVNLDDGNALYTTARGNKAGSGTVIDVTNLAVARKALREMKGLDGVTPISVTPKHLVVGAAKETEAEKVLADLSAAQVSEQNPFAGRLTLHVEPRLTGNAWRLFADPAELAVIQYAYLNGQTGPILETREGFETLGAQFRAVIDFGCGIVEWRGSYLNAGA